MIIAGIGSRETPGEVLDVLRFAGAALASQGHRGTSGRASKPRRSTQHPEKIGRL